MTNKKVLTQEEIDSLKGLKSKLYNLTTALGEIEITRLDLNNRKKLIEESLLNLFNEEKELAKKLEEKYGKGNISLETGEFSSIK
tara:strand:+ start:2835 stop:3089 length:255 start_codon:yes stop_codon:yes gene_type:complete